MYRRTVALAVCALLFAGCGGGGDSGGDSPETSSLGIANPSGAKKLVIGLPSDPGFTDLPLMATAKVLNAEGWDISIKTIEDQGLATAALVSNEVQLTRGAPLAALIAADQGTPVTLVAEGGANDWVVVGGPKVRECADMTGKKVGYQSEAGVSTAMLRLYADSCGAKPKFLIMAGSSVRAAAMIGGQLDATITQIADWLVASADKQTEAEIISNMGEELPLLATNTWAASREWAQKNEDLLSAFLANLLVTTRGFNDDHAKIVDAAQEFITDSDPKVIEGLAASFPGDVFASDGALTDERMKWSLSFFQDTGDLSKEFTIDQMSYRAPLDRALELIDEAP